MGMKNYWATFVIGFFVGMVVGAKLSKTTEKELEKLGYDVEEVIILLQKNLLQGDLTLPEGLSKESFVDD